MASRDRLVWIDLEMTGLDPDHCFIIEIATLVTDGDLEIVAEGPNLVIHATEEELLSLSDWSREFFTKNGLLDRVRASEVSLAEAEAQTLAFLKEHTEPDQAPLCGNSVHHDRMFLRRHTPRIIEHLHYRIVDVSSFKEVLNRWYPGVVAPPPKAETHEALADIRESVAELRYYRDAFFVPRD